MYHSGIHPAKSPHHFHLHTPFTPRTIILLLTIGLVALIGAMIYMTHANIPTNIEFRPIYFPGPLVYK